MEPKSEGNRMSNTIEMQFPLELQLIKARIFDARGIFVCDVNDAEDFLRSSARAEFIVLACNTHYEMLEALRDAYNYLDNNDPNAGVLEKIEAAILKAEEKDE